MQRVKAFDNNEQEDDGGSVEKSMVSQECYMEHMQSSLRNHKQRNSSTNRSSRKTPS